MVFPGSRVQVGVADTISLSSAIKQIVSLSLAGLLTTSIFSPCFSYNVQSGGNRCRRLADYRSEPRDSASTLVVAFVVCSRSLEVSARERCRGKKVRKRIDREWEGVFYSSFF